ncbi:uncharacterized protein K452DRAFT_17400 [Aplosporella prunicola CBS 121167]|uniref:Uncharacterized protein n=1 Tax=Aplosporella prunicola CBS 121167 TaxID=1176127 RepID=A0A6A6BGC5_9PEZI|nr:uncharacterized protein K452DRAFT_17400 [Aplosporella prunicola CBS 121167]KAF2142355.1 hypothetical protein K452DRAFT_17400 [Aplosporella prunicola CBS 121167]
MTTPGSAAQVASKKPGQVLRPDGHAALLPTDPVPRYKEPDSRGGEAEAPPALSPFIRCLPARRNLFACLLCFALLCLSTAQQPAVWRLPQPGRRTARRLFWPASLPRPRPRPHPRSRPRKPRRHHRRRRRRRRRRRPPRQTWSGLLL